MIAVADTHAVIWYLLNDERLSLPARTMFDEASETDNPVGISSISIVEMVYLTEKQRIPLIALTKLQQELTLGETILQIVPLTNTIAFGISTIDRNTVPDMPDRIIAATALYYNVPLISRDRKIRASTIETIW